MPKMLTQKALASALNLTPRRIQQLVARKILPPERNGRWDLDTCRDRYWLYSSGTEREWAEFFDGLERQSKEVEEMIAAAVKPSSTREQLKKAGRACDEMFEALEFAGEARPNSEVDREMSRAYLKLLGTQVWPPLLRRVREFEAADLGFPIEPPQINPAA